MSSRCGQDEVLAVRLYSGPAYQPINSFLRRIGRLSGAERAACAADASTTFTGTCKHICRAIRKLAAVAEPEEVEEPLFRAVRGELPTSFWAPDATSTVCATDTAFMSTSRNRGIFVEYMDVDEGSASLENVLWHLTPRAPSQIHRWRERGTIFCRGADISMLSQYAAEAEVLFPPCTMLVISGEQAAKDGDAGAGLRAATCHEQGRSFVSITAQPCFI